MSALKLPLSSPSVSVYDGISLGLVPVAFAFAIFHYGGGSNVWLICSFIALVFGCLIRVQPIWSGASFGWSAVHGWVMAYVAWLVGLIWFSTLPENSLIFARMMSAFTLVFLVCAGPVRDVWLRIFGGCLIAGLVSAFWGIGEYIVTARRASGPIVDPSSWASLHNLFFFGTLTLFLTAKRLRWVLGIAMFVFAVAVFCSYSRMATAVFVAALAFICLVTVRYKEIRGRLMVSVLISVLALSLVHGYVDQEEAAHSEGYEVNFQQKGWSQRLSMWRAGLELYADHPLVGSGPATFKVQYPRYRDKDDLGTLGNYVHNDYIQYLAEGGPVLLMFLLVFVGYVSYRLYRGTVSLITGDPETLELNRLESVGLTVAMGTALAHGLMSFVLYQLPVIMLMGLFFARTVKLAGIGRPRRIELANPMAGRAGSAIIALLLTGMAFLDELSNDLIYEHRFTQGIERGSLAYFDTIRWLTILRGSNSSNQFALATLYRMRFDQETDERSKKTLGLAAAMKYEEGLALNPFRSKIRRYYVGFLVQNPWLKANEEIRAEPESLLREGVRLGPTFAENYLALADYLKSRGRDNEAYELLKDWAWKWSRLKYPGYLEKRLEVFKRLLRSSRARGDTEIQRHIVRVLEGT